MTLHRDKNITTKIEAKEKSRPSQDCPQCGYPIGVLSGNVEAICKKCGYKDPCCE